MPASTCELPPITLHLPGANAVMNDIPVRLSASPSSLDVDNEQLTVRSHPAVFRPFANLSSPESESFIMLTRENLSLYVRPCFVCLLWRSSHLPLVLVRNRQQTDNLVGAGFHCCESRLGSRQYLQKSFESRFRLYNAR